MQLNNAKVLWNIKKVKTKSLSDNRKSSLCIYNGFILPKSINKSAVLKVFLDNSLKILAVSFCKILIVQEPLH